MALRAKTIAARLLAAMMLACALALVISCTGTSSMPSDANADEMMEGAEGAEGDAFAEDAADRQEDSRDAPDRKTLRKLLGKETAMLLLERASEDDDAAWIAAHPNAYKKYGSELQAKLLKLAADDPLAIPFVRHYPERAYADGPDYSAPAMDDVVKVEGIPKTRIPHLYQWDQRWGYAQFSADGFGLAGCGPTSLAMVYQGLTGKKDITPYDMGRLAEDQGYVIYGQGSTTGLFTEMPWQLGLSCWGVPVDAASIVDTLHAGNPIIANVGEGYFTQVGHFFVLAGVTKDGKVILNDPYSAERSSKLWDPEFIASESKALFAYAAV